MSGSWRGRENGSKNKGNKGKKRKIEREGESEETHRWNLCIISVINQ